MIPRLCSFGLVVGFCVLMVGGEGRATEPAKPAVISTGTTVDPIPLLRSPQESRRLAGLQRLQWGTDRDAAAVEALADLVATAVKNRKLTESAFVATSRLAECPNPAAIAALARIVDTGEWRLVIVAADGLAERRADADAVGALRRAYERRDLRDVYPVRHAIVCALGESQQSQGLDVLVGWLPELDGQLKYEAVARLSRRTGKNFGDNSQEWSDWWRREGAVLPEGTAAAGENPGDVPWAYVLPRFFGAPIYAKRVLFVVDHSRSMQSTRDGKTRLEAEQDELTKAIQKLPEDASFGVIVFNQGVEAWRQGLERATAENKAEAIRSIWALSAEGRTAAYDALEKGINMEGYVEQLLFLTDGKPTAGKITVPLQIVNAITKLNKFHHTRIDTLGLDTSGEPEAFLQQLAARNHGKYYKLR